MHKIGFSSVVIVLVLYIRGKVINVEKSLFPREKLAGAIYIIVFFELAIHIIFIYVIVQIIYWFSRIKIA